MSERRIVIDDREYVLTTGAVEVLSIAGNDAELMVNGRRVLVPFLRRGDEVHFMYEGETYVAEVSSALRPPRSRVREHSMSAPMPGTVLKVFVEEGAEVRKGAPLLILEAMKMEHQIVAPYDGVVEAVHCKAGELVQPGVDLISIEKKEPG